MTPAGEPPQNRESTGQTMWTGHINEVSFGIGWEWFELCPGVLALADPMMVMTNLFLLDDHGRVLSDDRKTLYLNSVIHELGWQKHVLAGSSRRALPAQPVHSGFRSPVQIRRHSAEPAAVTG
ncbi:MAG: hypothetical protein ABI564_05170 [Ideonella sp.]